MLKFSRLIVYLATFKQIGLTFEVFFQIIPFLKSFLGMLAIILLIFATIGINFFGGKISNKTPTMYKIKTKQDLPDHYIFINFNDLPSSILALYVNIINNNWIYFTNMFIMSEEDDRTWLRWYFVIFQLITNLFIMTILVGFIIDNILKQFEKIVEEDKKKKNRKAGEEGEKLLESSRKVADEPEDKLEGIEIASDDSHSNDDVLKIEDEEEDEGYEQIQPEN